jgi:hypothetical protein
MKQKKTFVTAVFLSGTVGLGAQSLFAQSVAGEAAPSKPPAGGQTGPAMPQAEPNMPPQTQPTIPGQPAPGLPQSKPFPGQPTPGLSQREPVPGQAAPLPGQPGTIPEKVAPPEVTNPPGTLAGSSEKTKAAQQALKARGFDPGSTSGAMDAKTQQALRDFQKANKLPPTGVLDPKTAQQLGIATESEQRSLPQSGSGSTTSQPGTSSATPDSLPR